MPQLEKNGQREQNNIVSDATLLIEFVHIFLGFCGRQEDNVLVVITWYTTGEKDTMVVGVLHNEVSGSFPCLESVAVRRGPAQISMSPSTQAVLFEMRHD